MHYSKKSLFFALMLIVGCFNHVEADSPILKMSDFPSELSTRSHPLQSFQNKFVQVRGFWYPISSDRGVLSAYADLKSCCLQTPAKIHQQLIVKGQLDSIPAHRVVTLEGIFKIEPLYNKEGELIQIYLLEEARELRQVTSYLPLALGLLLGFLFLCRFFLKRLALLC
jgi:hypothetical protein